MSETVQVSESSYAVGKREIFIGKTIPTKIEKFLATLFDLKPQEAVVLQKIVRFKAFVQSTHFLFALNI